MQDLHSHPYPAAPDFSTGKRLTWFSGRFRSPTNHVRLPPLFRGQNKTAKKQYRHKYHKV